MFISKYIFSSLSVNCLLFHINYIDGPALTIKNFNGSILVVVIQPRKKKKLRNNWNLTTNLSLSISNAVQPDYNSIIKLRDYWHI